MILQKMRAEDEIGGDLTDNDCRHPTDGWSLGGNPTEDEGKE